MKLGIKALNAETFARVLEERGGVLLYPDDNPVVLRALRIAEALDARLETLKVNLEVWEKNIRMYAAEGNWIQVGHYMKLADSYRSAIDELQGIAKEGDPVE
jgi:hypothetical protein